MSVKKIVTIPDPILSKKTEKVKFFDEDLKTLVNDLIDTVKAAEEPEGAGIASTQIGSSKRVCVVRDFFEDPSDPQKMMVDDYILVNPKIISTSKETVTDWEGCLSVPDQYGKVQRFNKIKLAYQDMEGTKLRMRASDLFARIIQHEIDHLDGILFTDKLVGKTVSEEEFDNLFEQGLL